MAALGSKGLFYVFWTQQSCTISRAEFDRVLWSAILDEVDNLYGDKAKLTSPQKRSQTAVNLKKC